MNTMHEAVRLLETEATLYFDHHQKPQLIQRVKEVIDAIELPDDVRATLSEYASDIIPGAAHGDYQVPLRVSDIRDAINNIMDVDVRYNDAIAKHLFQKLSQELKGELDPAKPHVQESGKSPEVTYSKLKKMNKIALMGVARRQDLETSSNMDEDDLIDEIMGHYHGDSWEAELLAQGVL